MKKNTTPYQHFWLTRLIRAGCTTMKLMLKSIHKMLRIQNFLSSQLSALRLDWRSPLLSAHSSKALLLAVLFTACAGTKEPSLPLRVVFWDNGTLKSFDSESKASVASATASGSFVNMRNTQDGQQLWLVLGNQIVLYNSSLSLLNSKSTADFSHDCGSGTLDFKQAAWNNSASQMLLLSECSGSSTAQKLWLLATDLTPKLLWSNSDVYPVKYLALNGSIAYFSQQRLSDSYSLSRIDVSSSTPTRDQSDTLYPAVRSMAQWQNQAVLLDSAGAKTLTSLNTTSPLLALTEATAMFSSNNTLYLSNGSLLCVKNTDTLDKCNSGASNTLSFGSIRGVSTDVNGYAWMVSSGGSVYRMDTLLSSKSAVYQSFSGLGAASGVAWLASQAVTTSP